MHTHTHTHTHAHILTRSCTHAHVCTHTHAHAHTHTHTHTHTHMCTHIHTHMHIHTYAHTCAHSWTHTQTHTLPQVQISAWKGRGPQTGGPRPLPSSAPGLCSLGPGGWGWDGCRAPGSPSSCLRQPSQHCLAPGSHMQPSTCRGRRVPSSVVRLWLSVDRSPSFIICVSGSLLLFRFIFLLIWSKLNF